MSVNSAIYNTTIRNTSGKTKKFGFLPPHGRSLTAGEEFTVMGTIDALFSGSRLSRTSARRNRQAVETALANSDIVILSTPSPVFEDQTTGDSKMLQLNNDTLEVADPYDVYTGLVSDSFSIAS